MMAASKTSQLLTPEAELAARRVRDELVAKGHNIAGVLVVVVADMDAWAESAAGALSLVMNKADRYQNDDARGDVLALVTDTLVRAKDAFEIERSGMPVTHVAAPMPEGISFGKKPRRTQ